MWIDEVLARRVVGGHSGAFGHLLVFGRVVGSFDAGPAEIGALRGDDEPFVFVPADVADVRQAGLRVQAKAEWVAEAVGPDARARAAGAGRIVERIVGQPVAEGVDANEFALQVIE